MPEQIYHWKFIFIRGLNKYACTRQGTNVVFFQLLYKNVISRQWDKDDIWGHQDWFFQSFSLGAVQLVGAGLVSASMARCFLKSLLDTSVRAGIKKKRKGFPPKFTEWLSVFPDKRQHLTPSLHWKGIFVNKPSHKSGLFYVSCKKISR